MTVKKPYKNNYVSYRHGYCQMANCKKQVPAEELRHIDDPRGILKRGIMVCESCYLKSKEKQRKDFWLSQEDREKYEKNKKCGY